MSSQQPAKPLMETWQCQFKKTNSGRGGVIKNLFVWFSFHIDAIFDCANVNVSLEIWICCLPQIRGNFLALPGFPEVLPGGLSRRDWEVPNRGTDGVWSMLAGVSYCVWGMFALSGFSCRLSQESLPNAGVWVWTVYCPSWPAMNLIDCLLAAIFNVAWKLKPWHSTAVLKTCA